MADILKDGLTRREFLKDVACGAGGYAVGKVLEPLVGETKGPAIETLTTRGNLCYIGLNDLIRQETRFFKSKDGAEITGSSTVNHYEKSPIMEKVEQGEIVLGDPLKAQAVTDPETITDQVEREFRTSSPIMLTPNLEADSRFARIEDLGEKVTVRKATLKDGGVFYIVSVPLRPLIAGFSRATVWVERSRGKTEGQFIHPNTPSRTFGTWEVNREFLDLVPRGNYFSAMQLDTLVCSYTLEEGRPNPVIKFIEDLSANGYPRNVLIFDKFPAGHEEPMTLLFIRRLEIPIAFSSSPLSGENDFAWPPRQSITPLIVYQRFQLPIYSGRYTA